jgi:hypothetical protein
MSIKQAGPEHEVAYQELCALVSKHADKVSALELLAIGANMVGKLIAMQDYRTVTREMAMEILVKNLETGNFQVREELAKAILGQKH